MKYENWDKIGRKIRKDGLEDLGAPTPDMVKRCIDEGRLDLAKELADYIIIESKGLHDLYVDWTSDMLDKVARRFGEEALYQVLRDTQSTWMMRRTWSSLRKMTPMERVWLNAEVFRSHRCGPRQMGELDAAEDDDRIALIFNPCGSGGRTRRGDPVNRTPSRYGPPYNWGRTSRAYPWSWSQAGVPYYTKSHSSAHGVGFVVISSTCNGARLRRLLLAAL